MIIGVNRKGRARARQKSDQKGKVNDYCDSFLMKPVFINRITVVRYLIKPCASLPSTRSLFGT